MVLLRREDVIQELKKESNKKFRLFIEKLAGAFVFFGLAIIVAVNIYVFSGVLLSTTGDVHERVGYLLAGNFLIFMVFSYQYFKFFEDKKV